MKKLIYFLILTTIITITDLRLIYAQASFNTGEFAVTLNEYGRVRLYTPDTSSTGLRQLERMSILVSGKLFQVFDYQNDVDNEELTINVENPLNSDYEIYGAFNNYFSSAPPNILHKLNILGWNGGKFIILKNTVINREPVAINAIVGMDIIPYLDYEYGFDTVTYNPTTNIIRSHRGGTNLGYKLLSHPLKSLKVFEWYDGYTVDNDYWAWLNYNTIDNQYISNTADGPVIITAQAPKNLAKGDSIIVYYAISAGANESEMVSNMQAAEEKYNLLTSIKSDFKNIPTNIELAQNYPNPFNPTTKISFGLPIKSNVTLRIFNLLGEQVTELLNESLEAGTYIYNYDASNLTSGIYVYSLQTEAGIISKKMTLIK